MGLKEFVLETVGDEEKANTIITGLHEYMVDKGQYGKRVDELNELKTKLNSSQSELEELRVAQMDEKEKMQFELDKAKKAEETYHQKMNRLEAEKMFASAGLSDEDYSEVIDGLVSTDAERTKKLVSGVLDVLNKTKESAVNKTKEEMLNDTPKPTGGNSDEEPPEAKPAKRFI